MYNGKVHIDEADTLFEVLIHPHTKPVQPDSDNEQHGRIRQFLSVRSRMGSYNANGEQTNRTLSGTSNTLAFDYDGQLSSITQGSSVVSFAYDAAGRRVSRTSCGTTTNFGIILRKDV